VAGLNILTSGARQVPRLIAVAVGVCALSVSLSGCGLWAKITGQERRAREQAQQLTELQHRCERFADRYAGHVIESIAPVVDAVDDPVDYDRLVYWQLTQVNSAYTIATGPNPVLCHLDFVVLATLSRMVVEDTLVLIDADVLEPVLTLYRQLEADAWDDVGKILTPAQIEELRTLVAEWRRRNPKVTLVGFVHFSEFAGAAGWSPESQAAPGSLFGLLGLDPLAGLDPAVRQIEQTRQLAERVIFYMQRFPYLLDLQTTRVLGQASRSAPVESTTASLDRASRAMLDFAEIGRALPDDFAREREALLRQLSGELLRQEVELRELLSQLQGTLAAGTETANAVDSAMVALDRLVARFPPREPGTEAAGRPFDVTEYTAAAREITETARQLAALVDALGRESQPVAAAVSGGVEAGRGLVDYLFRRALLLGLILILAALAAALVYRLAASRMGRRPPART